MRRRITRTFLTTAAAGATITAVSFTAAGAAGAAVHRGIHNTPSAPVIATDAKCTPAAPGFPIPSDNCPRAGYVASGRDFRYAQALITVPALVAVVAGGQQPGFSFFPQMYVALDASTSDTYSFVRAGISLCVGSPPVSPQAVGTLPECPAGHSGWVAYAEEMRNGSAMGTQVVPISGAAPGDGVFASVYQEPSGKVVHVVLKVPAGNGTAATHQFDFDFPGAAFTQAQALADWAQIATPVGAPQRTRQSPRGTDQFPQITRQDTVRLTQFLQGAFTTLSGQRGTFKGPWALTAPEVTSNGNLPPLGALIFAPSYLWNDGMGNGWGDAFGVWELATTAT